MSPNSATPPTELTRTLSFVVPMFDEEPLAAAAVRWCAAEGHQLVASGGVERFEVIVVDDGSSDRTADEVRGADAPQVQLVVHPTNRGVGAAIRSGLRTSTGDLVVYVDADLPVAAGATQVLLDEHDRTNAALVAAYRHGGPRETARRRLYSATWNRLVRSTLGLQLRDVNFAFKLVDGPLARSLPLTTNGGGIDAELLLQTVAHGGQVSQVPVEYQPRTAGRSTMSSPRNVAKMVRELVHLRRQRRVAASTGGWARVLRSYEGAGARVHLGVRGWSCPFEQLAGLVPEDGEVLDLGCGSGHFSLLLAHQHPKQRVLGVDLDERKLARAAAARSELLADDDDRVRFELVTSTWRPSRSFRAIVLVDVLYLVDPEDRASLVRNLADRLEPDGVLLIKEMDTRRRMRMVPVHIGELFMTRLTGITRSNGRPLRLPGVRSIERWMAAGGLEVDRRPLRGRVAPHVAVVGRRAR